MRQRRYLEPVRRLLGGLPAETHLPILSGPNAGFQWYLHSFNLSAWGGWYERKVQHCFEEHIRPGMVVFDCGAAAGFYTLLAVRLTGQADHVMAIEPSPRQLRWLRRNLHANCLDEVQVVASAISDRNGVARFRESFSTGSGGSLREEGDVWVDICTLDALAEKCPPDFIKIDVETAEMAALNGARKLLGGRRPLICLACHGGPLFPECAKILWKHKYRHLLIEGSCEYGTTLWTPEA